MYLPQKRERSKSTALLLVTTIVTGVFVLSYFSVQQANDHARAALEGRAATVAASLDAPIIKSLVGGSDDLDAANYHILKTKLTHLRQINTDARDVYLTGYRDGQVFYFVDSEKPGTAYYHTPGQQYADVSSTFKNIFITTPFPNVEGPLSDGHNTWVSGMAPVIDPETGQVIAVVGIDVDIVSFNENLLGALDVPLGGGLVLTMIVIAYESARRNELKMLRLRSELVSIASHELRSPLVGIRWALETFLKKHPADHETEKTMKAVYDSVIHLQAGTDDILQFTALAQQDQKLHKEEVGLRKLMTEICDAQRLVAQQKNVNLVVDDSVHPDLTVVCDPIRIRRAMHNLLSNAIKYTRSNTDVVLSYQLSGKNHLISVTDHGIGIPKLEQHRVFAGFYRASNAKASGVGGTGLGLYLTRVIMTQHGGNVTFRSEEGKGTTFTLILPVKSSWFRL